MPSLTFNDIILRLSKTDAHYLEISCNASEFNLKCQGDLANYKVIIKNNVEYGYIIKSLNQTEPCDIAQLYSIKDIREMIDTLYDFHKNTNNVDIFFTNHHMILQYTSEQNEQIEVHILALKSL